MPCPLWPQHINCPSLPGTAPMKGCESAEVPMMPDHEYSYRTREPRVVLSLPISQPLSSPLRRPTTAATRSQACALHQ